MRPPADVWFLPSVARRRGARASAAARSFSSNVLALALGTGLASAGPLRAAADEDELIIVDDEATVADDGTVRFGGPATGDEDDPIIIVDDVEAPLPVAPEVSGPLGRVWESWHFAADSEVLGAVQLADPEDGPWRLQGAVFLESWLLPTNNLSFFGTALARAGVDGTPEGRPWLFADLYELYARILVERATVNLGRIVVPWGRTQGAGFGDRLHPPDLRRGPSFPDPARQKQPQLGAQLRGALDVVGLEGVAFVSFDPSEGSLAAVNQGGVRIGRYQTALVRAPNKAGGLLVAEDTAALRPLPRLGDVTLAGRVWRRIGDIDVTGSVAWHFDETPTLQLAPDVAVALAGEALALRGLASTVPPPPLCGGDVALRCIGGREALTYARTTSLAVDASWGLGLIVVRAEAALYPRLGGQGGKTALVVDEAGLRSVQLQLLQTAVAVEGQLGPAIDGSLEVFDVLWDGVPRTARLWGVEVLRQNDQAELDGEAAPQQRQVNRLAVGGNLGGLLFGERVRWRLRGEAGLLQPDVLLSGEVRYRLPVFDLYIGGRGDVFTGLPGSPGWMRQDASLVGVFLGEGA
jgi:hypothetical protein